MGTPRACPRGNQRLDVPGLLLLYEVCEAHEGIASASQAAEDRQPRQGRLLPLLPLLRRCRCRLLHLLLFRLLAFLRRRGRLGLDLVLADRRPIQLCLEFGSLDLHPAAVEALCHLSDEPTALPRKFDGLAGFQQRPDPAAFNRDLEAGALHLHTHAAGVGRLQDSGSDPALLAHIADLLDLHLPAHGEPERQHERQRRHTCQLRRLRGLPGCRRLLLARRVHDADGS
mmetsp:Transcript_154397/g.495084  ORF Transcript_154397/g.495084 Transcript_154397/m.495084 type:complete len:228 (-) Transcript_154397:1123-1806(-)